MKIRNFLIYSILLILCSFVVLAESTINTTGLISYYKNDGNASDSFGNYDGTVSGATNSITFGKINEGYDFNGVDNYIKYGDIVELNNIDKFSLNFWIRVNDTTSNSIIYGKGTGSDVIFGQFITGDLRVYIGGSNIVTYEAPNENDYTMMTILYDGSETGFDKIETYYDAILQTKISTSGTIPATTPDTTGDEFWFGNGELAPTLALDGSLDEMSIWSKKLTSTDISDLYNNGDGLEYPFYFETDITNTTTTSTTGVNIDLTPIYFFIGLLIYIGLLVIGLLLKSRLLTFLSLLYGLLYCFWVLKETTFESGLVLILFVINLILLFKLRYNWGSDD